MAINLVIAVTDGASAESARPLQTQCSLPDSMSLTACSLAIRTSRLGSDHVIAASIMASDSFRPCFSA